MINRPQTMARPCQNTWRRLIMIAMVILLAPSIHANTGTLDEAVETFLRGFNSCTDANNLLQADVRLALERFQTYQAHLEQAAAINEEILTTTTRGMPSNLQFCQRVGNNISRALATPLLEHAFTFCEAAREALQRNELDQAESLLNDYRIGREDAFMVSETLMDVYLLASQVRNCNRLGDRIKERQELLARQQTAIQAAIASSERFKLECESTLAFTRSSRFGVLQIDQANAMLASAQTHKAASQQIPDALQFQREYPTDDLTLTWEATQSSARVCEGEVSELIRAAIREREQRKEVLSSAADQLAAAVRFCERADNLSDPGRSREELAEARLQHQQSTALVDQINRRTTPGQFAKLYPNWDQGRRFNQLMGQVNQCHVTAAQKMRSLQAALATLPERAPTAAELSPPPDLLSDDLPVDPEFSDDWDTDKQTPGRGGRRNWTDLVR